MPIKQGTSKTPEPEKVVDTTRHESEDVKDMIQILEGPESEVYAKDLAFLCEEVEIMIMATQDRSDTTQLINIAVDNKNHFFLRGEWTKAPRYVLEILAKSKKEAWSFNYKKNPDGSTSDVDHMSRILRYPHQFRDTNPEGMKWYDSIKDSFL